jgi:hypothetical protein
LKLITDMYRNSPRRLLFCLLLVLAFGFQFAARAQSTPLTSQELLRLVNQLPSHPEMKDEIVEEIRKRGIGFTLTEGLRSVVATKSGSDPVLRRTLDEAARRRLNPVASALPPEGEGRELWVRTRVVTLAASEAMPDFLVKQLIVRSHAFGTTTNWQVDDRLTIAVSYRASGSEAYKVLAVNGLPAAETSEANTYEHVGGTTSTGEYVSMLADLFMDRSETTFKLVDTDVLGGRRTLVYEYEVKQPVSRQEIKVGERAIIAGYHGKVWIDRELNRVLRLERIATDLPPDFPISAVRWLIDYDWVTINDHKYLLPSHADIVSSERYRNQAYQTRNDIRFRGYRKFGTEVKIIEETDDETPEKKP